MSGLCILCKQEQESRDNLFFECSFSKDIWKMVLSLCGLQRDVFDWNSELQWAVQKLKGKALISILMRVGWTAFIYHTWKERNYRLANLSNLQLILLICVCKEQGVSTIPFCLLSECYYTLIDLLTE